MEIMGVWRQEFKEDFVTKGYSVKRFWVLVQKALVCSISVDAHNNKLMVPAVDVDSSLTRDGRS
jgi:hypothetical protein